MMVEILLATFNGSRYVEQQIRSIMNQSHKDWRMTVHDDGSTDDTVAIIRRLAEEDSRIHIVDDGIVTGSPAANFMHLLRLSQADSLMFCDQDDVWYPEKVERMLKASAALPADRPGMVCSRAWYWFEGKERTVHTWRRFPKGLPALLGQKAAVQGSAMLINGAMRDTMMKYDGPMVMHDMLASLIAESFGCAIYMPEILMDYRQHAANVTGNNDEAKSKLKWLLSKISDPRPVMDNLSLDAIEGFRRFYADRLGAKAADTIDAFLSLGRKNRFSRMLTARKYGFSRDGSLNKYSMKLILSPWV